MRREAFTEEPLAKQCIGLNLPSAILAKASLDLRDNSQSALFQFPALTNPSIMANKQAACYSCRRSKVRCKRELGASICEKCHHSGIECVIPGGFHIGRQKGVKNKRTGLEKAIRQVEEALKKSKNSRNSNDPTTEQLQQLLVDAQQATKSSAGVPASLAHHASTASMETTTELPPNDDHLALDDAENPLQLLARASDLRLASPPRENAFTTSSSTFHGSDNEPLSDIQRFFLPMKAHIDQGPNYDPIDLGLVTAEEAEMLMSLYVSAFFRVEVRHKFADQQP